MRRSLLSRLRPVRLLPKLPATVLAAGLVTVLAAALGLPATALAGPTGPSQPGSNTPNATSQGGNEGSGCNGSAGMPRYKVDGPLVSLRINDTPLGCHAPIGPEVKIRLSYTQDASTQPNPQNFGNLGPNWYLNWVSYIQDNPQSPGSGIWRIPMGGGAIRYTGLYNASTGAIAPDGLTVGATRDQLFLVTQSPVRYELRAADGSKEVFTQSDNATSGTRRVFLTQKSDPQGNTVNLGYDSQNRLTTLTDAIGRITTLQYNNGANSLLVTDIYDPYGRHALVEYDANGRLTAITDVIGLRSTFTYDSGTVITAMTTPYGTTRFTYGGAAPNNWVNATDPLGNTERVEFNQGVALPFSDPLYPNLSPYGVSPQNAWLNYRNVFFWDKTAYKQAPGDYSKAHIDHFLHDGTNSSASGILESTKAPLQNRVLYTYPGVFDGGLRAWGTDLPWLVSNVLPDGSTAITAQEYNAQGNVTKRIDPAGRQTLFTYAANGIDLLSVRQQTASGQDTLQTYTWNSQHRPLTVTDAGGSITTYAYNNLGQVTQITDPLGRITRYTYDAQGFLQSITNPNGKVQEQYTYDSYGRIATKTDSEGYVERYGYDALDRRISIDYPDNTHHLYVWDKLDLVSETDRNGKTTQYTYDANRRKTRTVLPDGRSIGYGYDEAGRLTRLTDGGGRTTTWVRDIQGRVTTKIYPDGTRETYTYDLAGRSTDRTDALGQTRHSTYTVDAQLSGVQYLNALQPTPNVSYQYDPAYPRPIAMTDGQGSTTLSYVPPGTPGAGQVASIDGPLAADTLSYTYDALGRVQSRSLGGAAPSAPTYSQSYTYDSLDRPQTSTNPLGSFSFSYLGQTPQVTAQRLSGGFSLNYVYGSNSQDRRLLAILPSTLGGASHLYQWKPEGILSAHGELPGASRRYTYDGSDRLTDETRKSWLSDATNWLNLGLPSSLTGLITLATVGSQPISASYTYSLDGADNLVEVKTPSVVWDGVPNSNNQYVSAKGNTWQYDAAGNLQDDGTHRYTWDAQYRLLSITNKATQASSTFAYDGRSRLVQKTESATPASTPVVTRYLWCEETICQSQDGQNNVVASYYAEGEVQSGSARYYIKDHLGSVTDVVSAAGANLGKLDYGPYGEPEKASGNLTDFRYAGMLYHPATGFYFTHYRVYDPSTGRWLSRDPIGEAGGVNLYGYVGGNPATNIDPAGLEPESCEPCEGTMSCQYYDDKCTASNGHSWYYCRIAPPVCKNFPDSNWTRCVRKCLQDYDKNNCKTNPDGTPDIACTEVAAHEYCWFTACQQCD